MERRIFIKNTSLFAIAISTTGFVRFDGKHYIGDCETTSDILGPFYRPDSPIRNNLTIVGDLGETILLTGKIYHKDCSTPYKKAKIELWHCDSNGVYDNSSEQYRYRGTSFSDENGNYSFKTILPVPYDIGNGMFRPAHFHMMISAKGYQPLVTQVYFKGDVHISKDETASLPTAIKRILPIENLKNGTKKVVYNIGMSESLLAESSAIDKLVGTYTDEKDSTIKKIFFKKDNVLWMKNELFGVNFDFIGNNTFTRLGSDPKEELTFHFELLPTSLVKLTISSVNENGEKQTQVLVREKT
ncbi:dioxygenase family protein [Flavobacterium cellulosilyticum]|uniref:Catechol 1,2-dioxygenase n=1 Tax=Flavobacterium cellulosilyticum TaxID=2541731 RepID=A0A4R5CDB7_9FLAO|nr:catechol 1,2-dioxygenase [Flavobacterium cellulosilyticum]TDD98028.1 catechol 1,2-dioxygenase [Flavobacterium cellulosilyticum]